VQPIAGITQRTEGKLEHFGTLLPWVMSKLVLTRHSVTQPWKRFPARQCPGSIPWDNAGVRAPLAGAEGTHGSGSACCHQPLPRDPGTKGRRRGSQQEPPSD